MREQERLQSAPISQWSRTDSEGPSGSLCTRSCSFCPLTGTWGWPWRAKFPPPDGLGEAPSMSGRSTSVSETAVQPDVCRALQIPGRSNKRLKVHKPGPWVSPAAGTITPKVHQVLMGAFAFQIFLPILSCCSVAQSCPTLCDPMDCSTPPFLSITNSWSLLKLMSMESVKPANHFILCRPLFLLPSIVPSIRVFSNESALRIRWLKYWRFSFSISPSKEYSGLISFRMDWFDLLVVQETHSKNLHASQAPSKPHGIQVLGGNSTWRPPSPLWALQQDLRPQHIQSAITSSILNPTWSFWWHTLNHTSDLAVL